MSQDRHLPTQSRRPCAIRLHRCHRTAGLCTSREGGSDYQRPLSASGPPSPRAHTLENVIRHVLILLAAGAGASAPPGAPPHPAADLLPRSTAGIARASPRPSAAQRHERGCAPSAGAHPGPTQRPLKQAQCACHMSESSTGGSPGAGSAGALPCVLASLPWRSTWQRRGPEAAVAAGGYRLLKK